MLTRQQLKNRRQREKKKLKEKEAIALRKIAREEQKARAIRLEGVPYTDYTNEELKEEISLQLDRRDRIFQLGMPDILVDDFDNNRLNELLTIARERNMNISQLS